MACDGSEREQRRQVELRWSDALTREETNWKRS
jgi:hypothetical protein